MTTIFIYKKPVSSSLLIECVYKYQYGRIKGVTVFAAHLNS